MKILLTNHHLVSYGGTEVFTYELAKLLHQNGHEVCVYTKYLGKLEEDFNKLEVPVTTDLSDYEDIAFDVAHIHHNITAIEVRDMFPELPLFFLSHGYQPFLEQPPEIDINIAFFGGVSLRILKHLREKGIPAAKTVLFRNIFDDSIFTSTSPIHEIPERALVISSKLSQAKEEVIRDVCQVMKMQVKFVGGRHGEIPFWQLPDAINEVDIVFSLGRGAMEAMLCGRIPVILDEPGFDGLVTPDNFEDLQTHNFSGKKYQLPLDRLSLIKELSKYNASDTNMLRLLAQSQFAASVNYPHIMDIYSKTIRLHKSKKLDTKVISYFVQSIKATNFFGYGLIQPLHSKILRSKFYKVWRVLNRLKTF